MITLYAWGTPNGRKPLILLEELALPYELVRVNLAAGEQRAPDYLRRNPNGKIPTLHDTDGDLTIFESGAILLYLAEKTGRFLPSDPKGRNSALSWLFFQMASVGPMLGQASHFGGRRESSPYAWERYTNEAGRIFGVLDARLSEAPFLGGAEYGIADIATYPWVMSPTHFGIQPGTFAHVDAWTAGIGARPAVGRAMAVPFPG